MERLNPEAEELPWSRERMRKGAELGGGRSAQAGEQHIKTMGNKDWRRNPREFDRTGREIWHRGRSRPKEAQTRPQKPWEPLEAILPDAKGMDEATRIQIIRLCSFLPSLLVPNHRSTFGDQNHSRLSESKSTAHACTEYFI